MPSAKGVDTIFVFPVIGLSCSPEPKTTYFFVCPHKWALHASVIESNPGSVSVMTVLNINIFLLVVHCHQIWTHGWAICFCGHPRRACGTCEVAITAKVTPSLVANIWILRKQLNWNFLETSSDPRYLHFTCMPTHVQVITLI